MIYGTSPQKQESSKRRAMNFAHPSIEVMDKADRTPLELRDSVFSLSFRATHRFIHDQQIDQRRLSINLNPRGAHARQFPLYFRIGH